MTDVDELERRKKELELRRDIARLERQERFATKVSVLGNAQKTKAKAWKWVWVAPVALLGVYFLLGGLVEGSIIFAVLGVLLVVPAIAKLL